MKKLIAIATLTLAAFTAQAEPSLYGCDTSRGGEGLFFVISPETGEFMIFDKDGKWVNRGSFVRATANDGRPFFAAQVGTAQIGFQKVNDSLWRLVIINDDDTKMELFCR